MRRLITSTLTLGLASAFLMAPTVTLPTLAPTPVSAKVEVLKPVGVDQSALAQLQKGAPAATAKTAPQRLAAMSPEALGAADRTVRAAAAAAAGPVVLTAARDTNDFSLVGVTWDADGIKAADVEVLARVREGGTWSEWYVLEANDGGPDANTVEGQASRHRAGTSPLLTGVADGVQVRVDTADGIAPAGLQVSLIDPGTSPGDAALDAATPTASAFAATSAPAMITRAQWGADESIAKPTSRSKTLKVMFVHHTATTNSYSGTAAAAAQIRAIYAYHVKGNGWSDIGYNFLVDRAGTIFEGRRGSINELVVGAHTEGFNTNTMAVSALGNYDIASPPAAVVNSIARVAAWKLGPQGVNPSSTTTLTSAGGASSRYAAGTVVTVNRITPHGEVGLTACPGRYLKAQLASIRTKASALAPQYPLTMASPVSTPPTPIYAAGSTLLSANLSAAVLWGVTVQSMCGATPIRTFTGSTNRISATWNLKTSTGAWAPPGLYVVKYTAINRALSRDIEVLPRVGSPAGACSTSRIAGSDRYETSVVEGRTAFPSGSSVVIVSGAQQNLVDGLVAGPLAFAKQAPVLLAHPTSLPTVVADEIKRRAATTAWIVGGTGAVTPAVETQLRSLGVTTVNRRSGTDRYGTAADVALEMKAPTNAVIVASGLSLVDAVAASGPAARLNRPILLVSKDSVPPSTTSALQQLGITAATVVGGPGVISERARLALNLASMSRVAGDDRFGTAAEITRVFAPLVGTETMAVASGMDANLVDALAGGAMGRLTLLVRPTSVPASAWTQLAAKSAGKVQVLGGPGAVTTATLRSIHLASYS